MCILFVHHNNDGKSKYKLIVAANRDEYMSRPTKPADFHQDCPDVLSGIDMQEGVEGGTWLGVTKSGKFSAITNFLVQAVDESKLPRGQLVINYLKGELEPVEYLKTLQNKNYRACNIFAGRVNTEGNIELGFYSTQDGRDPRLLNQEINVLASTHINGSWRKVEHGRNKFVDILSTVNNEEPDKLTDTLFDSLLSDTKCLYPDQNVYDQCQGSLGENILEKYCSIKIDGLKVYGTRMQTVVLIDKDDIVHFTEKSLSDEGTWTRKSFEFAIEK